nr:hypothetical protein [Sphingobium sp. PNB]
MYEPVGDLSGAPLGLSLFEIKSQQENPGTAHLSHNANRYSQKWNNGWSASQRAAAHHRGTRDAGRTTPMSIAIATSRKIKPMSQMKCGLNGPVVVTPGTPNYKFAGEISIKRPFAADARPSTVASASGRFRLMLRYPATERQARIAVRDGGHELKELRGAHDCVGYATAGDRLLLRQLGAKKTRCLKAIGPHHRQCHDVVHVCVACCFQQVGCRTAEESESGSVLERGGIADIDHDGGISQRLCQAGASQRIDAGAR